MVYAVKKKHDTNDAVPEGTSTSLKWIKIRNITAEYNPKRAEQYKSLFKPDFKGNYLDMRVSPMYDFVKEYVRCKRIGEKFYPRDTRYFAMQKAYGRSDAFAIAKCSRFVDIYESIEKIGLKTPPLITIKEDSGYQMKDGHHRMACCMALKHKQIICKVIKGQV